MLLETTKFKGLQPPAPGDPRRMPGRSEDFQERPHRDRPQKAGAGHDNGLQRLAKQLKAKATRQKTVETPEMIIEWVTKTTAKLITKNSKLKTVETLNFKT